VLHVGVDAPAAAGYASPMRLWPVLLLAACGAASKPAPPADDNVLRGDYGGVAPVPHEVALAHIGVVAEVPAGFEARIVSPQSIRLDGDALTVGISRLETRDVPTVAAFVAKGYVEDGVQVQSSEQWDGGWWAVFAVPTDPMRMVQAEIRAGEDDLFCIAVEDDEIRKDTVEIATKLCRSVRPR
jgi:hypothetical protein